MESSFRFRKFEVRHGRSALKVGTDAVLLGAAATVRESDRYAVDVGTGCGVIALMIAQRSPSCSVTGIDIDRPSADEAALNFSLSPWSGRLGAVCIPLSDFVPDAAPDLIVSNPPYYDSSLRNPDERKAAARHTGTLDFAALCSFAAERLSGDGRLSVIIPSDSLKAFRRIAASFGLLPFRILEVRTTAAKPPSRVVAEFSRNGAECLYEGITLLENGSKTAEYASLTRDFYL